ncbi:PadR family transcriptional regulator [Metallosphaera sedula]|uniref:Transcriptional regulator, PadR family n=3 Tax=Metallosphaera TaxID=41980 RepID=A4YGH7_METS5|nr:PadR family transcriptional regulator [Metallosphaera sedula]ABP95529.1 transcriptional regulator, PadR family [Metallosphaera sedula DSM 5348]QCO31031.1 PadR family transcriptional regulator [Metallosphaera prunae]AIM27513.1 transcriptional regulator, PadR family [Metallosphaera sedula]AKV74380.1 PadR family transcriptional regulator [Metallosphaera sedula]AKV76619.1 PadR family transcriptional regulator [Metallosphaera sedula]
MFHHGFGHRGHRRGLRFVILFSLNESPKNGIEIMKEIESMTKGWWRPSPGSLYPMLAKMSQEGFIRRREDGKYELTEIGKEEIEIIRQRMAMMSSFKESMRHEASSPEEILEEMEFYVDYLEDLKKNDPTKISNLTDRIKRLSERLMKVVS